VVSYDETAKMDVEPTGNNEAMRSSMTSSQRTSSQRVSEYVDALENGGFFGDADVYLSLEYMIRYYRRRIPWQRRAFVLVAVVSVVAGAVNAFVAARGNTFFDVDVKDTLVTAISIGISTLGAINGIFRYERSWNQFTAALFSLEHLKRKWERAKVDALMATNEEAAVQELGRVATFIEEEAHSVTTREMQGFFEFRQLPEIAKSTR